MSAPHELCTIVDYPYLARLLVLHRSLVETGGDFRLRVVCMDDATKVGLERLALRDVLAIPIAELERDDPELAAVRPTRTTAEYCWTAKATIVARTLRTEPELEHLAYVDVDHVFRCHAAPLLDALGAGCVLVVPQRTDDDRAGRFNAGYILFRRTGETDRLLAWWRERCLERCDANGLGDQGYLTGWPDRFDGVRVLDDPAGGLAPWNSARVQIGGSEDDVRVDGRPLLFYHHQSLRIYRGLEWAKRAGLLGDRYGLVRGPVPFVWTIGRWYVFPAAERKLIWAPYAARYSEALARLRELDAGYDPGALTLGVRAVAAEALRALVVRPARRLLARLTRVSPRRRPAHG